MAKAIKIKTSFHLRMSLYSLVKFYLRGISSVSFAQPMMSRIQQAKIGERIAITLHDPKIGFYTVVAVRKSLDEGIVVTGWAEESVDVGKKARELLEMCYQVISEKGISSWDIKKEKKWMH